MRPWSMDGRRHGERVDCVHAVQGLHAWLEVSAGANDVASVSVFDAILSGDAAVSPLLGLIRRASAGFLVRCWALLLPSYCSVCMHSTRPLHESRAFLRVIAFQPTALRTHPPLWPVFCPRAIRSGARHLVVPSCDRRFCRPLESAVASQHPRHRSREPHASRSPGLRFTSSGPSSKALDAHGLMMSMSGR